MHDVLVVGIPLVAILAGILFNRTENRETRSEIRAEIKDLRTEVMSRLSQIDSDLRQFYHLNGKLEGRMDAMEKRG